MNTTLRGHSVAQTAQPFHGESSGGVVGAPRTPRRAAGGQGIRPGHPASGRLRRIPKLEERRVPRR